MSDSNAPLTLALPSKGRLKEQCDAWLSEAGFKLEIDGGERGYRASLRGLPGAEVRLLSAGDIASAVDAGEVHLGVTGEDLVRERPDGVDERVMLLKALGFGRADLVVAAPQSWIDVETMADIGEVAQAYLARTGNRLRVATKYAVQTRGFFARHGVADYRIVESLGATEGAPAAGTAELIVDITSTGATLAANGLKVLDDGVMLRSEANLVASMRAEWSPGHVATARAILSRIAAEEAARLSRDVVAEIAGGAEGVSAEAEARFEARLVQGDGARLTFRCGKALAAPFAEWLIDRGASTVAVTTRDYLFTAQNPLFEKLLRRVGSVPA
jgi:ATP phosphoribosyltransferase